MEVAEEITELATPVTFRIGAESGATELTQVNWTLSPGSKISINLTTSPVELHLYFFPANLYLIIQFQDILFFLTLHK